MAYLLTSTQMRSVEAAAIGSGQVTGRGLMERAGAAVVGAIDSVWPGDTGPAVVLCGPGNNGGDGYVVARLLASRCRVAVFATGEPKTADARLARADWTGPVHPLSTLERQHLAKAPLVIDALFGSGLVRPAAAQVWGALALAQACGCRIVAVDVLSGLCSDSGRIRADGAFLDRPIALTVTFDSARLAHVLAPGGQMSERLVVADIGLAQWRDAGITAGTVRAATPGPAAAKVGGHKYDHGHVLVLSGGPGHGGAARLAARGALRVGAGLVTLACPPGALAENAARLDAVMLHALAGADALARLLGDSRLTAVCLGPGLGIGRREAALIAAVLRADRATVLDADALTLLAQDPGLRKALHPRCVLTPHDGEFARLFPRIAAHLAAPAQDGTPAFSRVDAARHAAALTGCLILLKGADTVIAAPDGRCSVHAALRDRASPWLATAGSGDVLAGILTGLLARGFPAFEAAETAAWLHAEAALTFGPGLIAEDLPDLLPKVLRRMAAAAAPNAVPNETPSQA